MTGEAPSKTRSGRPRQRNPKHWLESQKIFTKKGTKSGAGHHHTKPEEKIKRQFKNKEQKRLYQQRHFRGKPPKSGLTKKERKAAERKMKHKDKRAERRKKRGKYIDNLKKKLKGIADIGRRKKIEKRIKKLEGTK